MFFSTRIPFQNLVFKNKNLDIFLSIQKNVPRMETLL